ncbi:MAG: PBECR4 domain-containing protein [Clostridiales bacterium]|nr:PBECR4 domain-containing protein [Clostridiales bacterium]
MDKLQERALTFNELMKYQYDIKLGKKGKLYEFTIDFQPSDFFHLIGLQKLIDLRFLKRSAEHIFNECLKGNITYSMIAASQYFDELGYRFEYFNQLENILDSNNLIFKFNKNSMQIYSKIIADYMLKHTRDDLIFYLFIEQRNKSNTQFCKSFFENSVIDYSRGQTNLTLLYKGKINIRTGEREIKFDRLTQG